MALIFGVMSTFRPDQDVVERALVHARLVDHLIVVDDGSPDSAILDSFTSDNIQVVRLNQNSGIAKALNTGLKIALGANADFILTLDQDSVLDKNYLSRVMDTFERAARATRLGVVLTDCVNHQPSIPPLYSPEGFGLVEEGIQSGLVVSAACLKDIGLLDERLFIDCVDIEFCLRARDRNWRVAVAPGSNITHSLGHMTPFRPFGRQKFRNGMAVEYQYHPPFRRYYIVRNNVDLCIRNVVKRPRWVLSVLRRELTPQIKVLISGPHVSQQWLASTVGLFHGLVRRRGKIPTWLTRALQSRL